MPDWKESGPLPSGAGTGGTVRRAAGGALLVGAMLVASVPARVQESAPAAPTRSGATARLTAAEARAAAREAERRAALRVADGLEARVWAPAGLVADPLGIDLGPDGTAYVASAARSGMLLDIRQHSDWVPDVHTLRSTDDLRAFFRRVMAPDRSDENSWLPDLNADGSRDYRDLMVTADRIYRVQDTDGDGIADSSLVAYEGFNDDIASDIIGGLFLNGRDLYVTAAPFVWRLRDTDDDGVFDEKTVISQGYSVHPAFSGHDLSAAIIGPDGRLYWKVGDIGLNVVDQTGRRWVYANQGAVLRANPDGSQFEVFATGLRNTQEIAFDSHGNLVSVDNDGDHRGETERVVYITQGSDAGWRSTWQYGKYSDPKNNDYNVWMDEGLFKPRFEGQAAYITPPVAAYHAGPSGFAFNPGTAVGDRWRNYFFVTSFTGAAATARVYAFQLEEQGAGFALAHDTEIVRGLLSSGIRIGADGALYLTDWIRGWGATGEGMIWRLDSPGAARSAARREVKTLLTADFAGKPVAELQDLLAHADMRVRQRAQFELVRRGEAAVLRTVAADADAPLARLHALWGLGQLARQDLGHAMSIRRFLGDADAEVRAQAARMLGDARDVDSTEALLPLVADPAPRVRFFATEALGRIGAGPAVAPIVAMLAANDDEDVYLRTAGVHALESIGDRAAIRALSTHPSVAVRLAAVVALRRLRDPGLAPFVVDQDPRVATEAARAINDEGGVLDALPALARGLESGVMEEPFLRRAINANLRVGTADAAARVGTFAGRPGAPPAMRVEAVSVLGVWGAPSTLDRVDGAWLGPAQRDAAAARTAASGLLPLLDEESTSVEMKVAILDAAARLALRDAAARALARLREDDTDAVRLAALRTLQALGGTQAEQGVRIALADDSADVRMDAISAMPSMPIPDTAKASNLSSVVASSSASVGERQSAIRALGAVGGAADAQLGELLDRMAAGDLAPELQLDVVEAAQATGREALLVRLDRMQVGRSLDRLATAFPGALTHGGAAPRGRQIALQQPAAQCTRCHTLGRSEANVAPNLNDVGSRLSRDELLRSLIEPSAVIAPGFGTVSITLRSGETIDGVVRSETADAVTLEVADAGLRRIAKTDIAGRTSAVSAMPPMGALLQPRQIRDVVEFLATLR